MSDRDDAKLWRALIDHLNNWSRVDGLYGVSHWNEMNDEGELVDQHDTLEQLADALAEKAQP